MEPTRTQVILSNIGNGVIADLNRYRDVLTREDLLDLAARLSAALVTSMHKDPDIQKLLAGLIAKATLKYMEVDDAQPNESPVQ